MCDGRGREECAALTRWSCEDGERLEGGLQFGAVFLHGERAEDDQNDGVDDALLAQERRSSVASRRGLDDLQERRGAARRSVTLKLNSSSVGHSPLPPNVPKSVSLTLSSRYALQTVMPHIKSILRRKHARHAHACDSIQLFALSFSALTGSRRP